MVLPESRRAVAGLPFIFRTTVVESGGEVAWRAHPASQGMTTCCREAGSGSVGMGSSLGVL